jgi:hypothetical protein
MLSGRVLNATRQLGHLWLTAVDAPPLDLHSRFTEDIKGR